MKSVSILSIYLAAGVLFVLATMSTCPHHRLGHPSNFAAGVLTWPVGAMLAISGEKC